MVSPATIITAFLSCLLLIPALSVNVAFGGGGLKIIAISTALTSSLLSLESKEELHNSPKQKRGKQRRKSKSYKNEEKMSTLAGSHFMEGVDTIVGVSAGSWFVANLIYSKKFVSMVEAIAASITSPSSSGNISDIFNEGYSQIFIDAGASITGAGLPIATQITSFLQFAGFEINPNFMAAVYEKNGNPFYAQWSDLAEFALVDDIPTNATMSYQPQEWAEGKMFVPVVMAATPVLDGVTMEDYMWIDTQRNGQKYQFIKYTCAFNDSSVNAQKRFFPARFSHVLGSSGMTLHHAFEIDEDVAPLPFAAPTFFDSTINYDGMDCKASGTCDQIFSKTYKSSFDLSYVPPLMSYGDMPIIGAIAASSAILAIEQNPLVLGLFDGFNFEASVKFSPILDGRESFDYPRELFTDIWTKSSLTQTQFDQVTSDGMLSLADGAGGDYDGIGTMLATGASEFFVVSNTPRDDWSCHFRDANCDDPTKFEIVYQYPLFSEDLDYAETQKKQFRNLTIVDNATFLFDLRYGTVTATTMKSDLFGIEEGRKVTFKILIVDAAISTLAFDDYFRFGQLCQEVSESLTSKDNEDVLTDIYNFLES